MSDLISRSALIEVITKYKFGAISNDVEREYTKETVLRFISTTPTVKAKPVESGEWIEAIGENYWFDYTCSICGELEEFEYNFCPNCGADMRGEKHD